MNIKRKLGDPVPKNLIIEDGIIKMKDGGCLRYYLKKDFQDNFDIPDGTSISIVPSNNIEKLEKEILFLRSLCIG